MANRFEFLKVEQYVDDYQQTFDFKSMKAVHVKYNIKNTLCVERSFRVIYPIDSILSDVICNLKSSPKYTLLMNFVAPKTKKEFQKFLEALKFRRADIFFLSSPQLHQSLLSVNQRILSKVVARVGKVFKLTDFRISRKLFQSIISAAAHIKEVMFLTCIIDSLEVKFSQNAQYKIEILNFSYSGDSRNSRWNEKMRKFLDILLAINNSPLKNSLKTIDVTGCELLDEEIKSLVKKADLRGSQIMHISTKKDIETKKGSNFEAVGATSCVFQSQQNNEGRERESESLSQEEPSSDGPEGDQGSSDSYQNTKSFESQNTPVPSVVQEKRVTIKDMIDSQKLSGKKRKRTRKSDITSITTKSDRVDDESKIESPKPVIPQKKIIFVNGKAQIDQSSLLIEESHFRREEDDPKYFKVINDDEYSTSNALIYPKKSKTKKWSEEETDFFFKSVEEWGTDFTMIESKFNGTRSRAQIKNKFKKEEKVNPEKVDAALARTYTQRYAKKRDIKEREKQSEVVQTS